MPGTPAAVGFATALLGAWGLALLPAEAFGSAFPPVAAGELVASTCGVAIAALLPCITAGLEPGLAGDGCEEAWLGEAAPPPFFAEGVAGPEFVDADFAGAALVDAEFVDAEFAGAEFAGAGLVGAGVVEAGLLGAEFVGAGLDDGEFPGPEFDDAGLGGAGLAACGGFAGVAAVSDAVVAASSAANGWESVCGAGAGAGADHCDCANHDVELTSDAVLDTA